MHRRRRVGKGVALGTESLCLPLKGDKLARRLCAIENFWVILSPKSNIDMTQSTADIPAPSVLLGLTVEELKQLASALGLPAFVGKQLAQWIYGKCVTDFSQMTNLSLKAREKLAATCCIGAHAPAEEMRSVDGTVKYLYRTRDGHFIESVYIPDGDRATLCVSSQVGCKMGCAFCMTGRQGFSASLDAAEILNQIYALPERERLTNVVFMGQGEPFDNVEAVLRATQVLTADWGFAWSPKRITVSTVGLRRGLRRFLDESKCHLAISLHHPLHEGRAALMPAERAFPIREVVDLLRQYDFCTRRRGAADIPHQRRLSFEYIVFDGVNDSREHARALVELLDGLDCRINLIRFHDIPATPLRGVDDAAMLRLRDFLTAHGIFTTIRASRGQDIFAACGLLSTKKQEEMNRK